MKRFFRRFAGRAFPGLVAFCAVLLTVAFIAVPLVAVASDVTLGDGVEALRAYVLNGSGSKSETWTPFMKGQMGDYAISLSSTTAAPTATGLAAASADYEITITVATSDGETHAWYDGPIDLTIADTCASADATISPVATSPLMSEGVYTVTVTLPKGSYTASEDVTLTVSDPGSGFGGWPVSPDVTFVATVN